MRKKLAASNRAMTLAVLGFGLLLGLSAFSFWSGSRFLDSNQWREHSNLVLLHANQLQVLVERAETAQRGFIITGQGAFLEPYVEVRGTLASTLNELAILVRDNTEQGARVDRLESAITGRLLHLEEAIRLTREGQGARAVKVVAEGAGRRLMDDVRNQFNEFTNAEMRLLKARTRLAEESFATARHVVSLGLLVTFALLISVMLFLRDEIRRRHQSEKSLIAAEARANEASELKSQFLANMSHEIRTPLNGIIGMSRLLGETRLDPEQKGFVDVITDSSNALLALINEVLDLSKIESGKLQLEEAHFELRSLLQSTQGVLGYAATAKGIALRTDIADDIPDMYLGDPLRLRQIILNLMNNAIKFSEVGTVTLRVSKAEEKDSFVGLLFEVIDEGIGFDEATRGRLFQKFSQGDHSTTRRYGGTGLGLSISKQLVELMGGAIDVESTPGRGSRFFFHIRFRAAKFMEYKTPIHDPGEQKPLDARVLVAEDNLTNQKVIAAMLKRMGCRFQIVGNGAEALAALAKESFDLVLMDGQMPVMDGYETARQIRVGLVAPGSRRIPILAVTANAIKGDLERCLEAGMNDYVSKPISQDDLRLKMRKWLAHVDRALDPAQLARLRALEGEGTPSLVKEVVSVFRGSGAGVLRDLRDAVRSQDRGAIKNLAHSFKSTCANVGAVRLRESLSRVEKTALEGDLDALGAQIEALEADFVEALRELESYEAA